MKIQRVAFAPGASAFFFDDQQAIKAGARHDGFVYEGAALTGGFRRIRERGECVSILLTLSDGSIAVGDCAAVQYSGAGGRDPLFLAETYIPFLEKEIRPRLEGMAVESFRAMAEKFESLVIDGNGLHTAVRYGISQALLDARALSEKKLACEVVAEEWGLPLVPERVSVFTQSGDNRYENVDKMILKEADVLPHGLFNSVEKLGQTGEKLQEYVAWLAERIRKIRISETYVPQLHIDVYGTIGLIFDHDPARVAEYLAGLEPCAEEFELYIEGPVDMGGKAAQIEALTAIRQALRQLGSTVKIVADEWCNTLEDVRDFTDAEACHMAQIKTPDLGGIQNTVEAVLYCRAHDMEAYQGGTCNETDVSARACVHAAMATRPTRMLAKPGMGVDEGFCIVNNEMARIICILQ